MVLFATPIAVKTKPYLLLAIAGILAYLPVSTMAFALKNDVVALELPINYFISAGLHSNSAPLWFNTWALGFPLESILTWSIFSPVLFVFGGLFHYSLYTLHIEFVFFIVLSGWSLYYLLGKHFSVTNPLRLLLSCSYMLGGFTVGSSQWLLYITAAAFLPLLMAAFLSLIKKPGVRNALVFSAIFYIQLTSVYVAFTIVACYLIAAATIYYLLTIRFRENKKDRLKKTVGFLALSFFIILVLSFPSLYSSLQVLKFIDRGAPVAADTTFFNSNYLPPQALQTLLLPFTSIKMQIFNTEGTMLHSYIGLLPLLLLPPGLQKSYADKNRSAFLLLLVSIFFLLLASGNTTPLRAWLNILPGFSYFRNPGLLRLFFIFFYLLFICRSFAGQNFSSLAGPVFKKTIRYTFWAITLFFTARLLFNSGSLPSLAHSSLKTIVQNITYGNTVLISVLTQTAFLLAIVFSWLKNRGKLLAVFVFAELIFNTLICVPFFTVSSYSVKEVNDRIYRPVAGFPVQTSLLSDVATTYQRGGARWYNVNVFQKEVSGLDSYWGPLVLKNFTPVDPATVDLYRHPVIFSDDPAVRLTISEQHPDRITADIKSAHPASVVLLQNFYPGWKAFFNGKEIPVQPNNKTGMRVMTPSAGRLQFTYDKRMIYDTAIATNLLVLGGLVLLGVIRMRSVIKFSFPSWP